MGFAGCRSESPVALRLLAVRTLHDLLASPHGMRALCECGLAPQSDDERGTSGAATDETVTQRAVALMRRQPQWLAALASRADDADPLVRAAAIDGLTECIRASSGSSDEMPPGSASCMSFVAIATVMRQKEGLTDCDSGETSSALDHFLAQAEISAPDHLAACQSHVP
eukprot:scaffold74728_cov33-Prasinocladus_malaysianus.AAC.3